MSTFTPEQIQEILDLYFENFAHRQYIGQRYVPVFGRKDETTIEWDNTKPYEPLTIVLNEGNSYTSRQFVPIGVEITNQTYWALTGNFNAQVELYRQHLMRISELIPDSEFDSEHTVKSYIDTGLTNIGDLIPDSDFDSEHTIKDYIDNGFFIRAKSFETVSDMVDKSALLEVGMICKTYGFNSAGDGGAAYYSISDTGTANGKSVISCGDLFAHLIYGSLVKPAMLGAAGDGTTDDSLVFKLLFSLGVAIDLDEKTYKIDNTAKPLESNTKIFNGSFICTEQPTSTRRDAYICASAKENISIDNVKFTGSGALDDNTQTGGMIWLYDCENVEVVNCEFEECPTIYTVCFENCSKGKVIGNRIDTYSYSGIAILNGGSDFIVNENRVIDCINLTAPNTYPITLSAGDEGFVSHTQKVTCIGNYVENTDAWWEGIDAHGLTDSVISGNTVIGCYVGIAIPKSPDSTPSDGITITDNVLIGAVTGEARSANNMGIVLNTVNNAVIANNVIKDFGKLTTTSPICGGIDLSTCTHIKVIGNNITNCKGVAVNMSSSNTKYVDVSGNEFIQDSATLDMYQGIYTNAIMDECFVHDNVFRGFNRISRGINTGVTNATVGYFKFWNNNSDTYVVGNPKSFIPESMPGAPSSYGLIAGRQGDIIWNNSPAAADDPIGWVCTASMVAETSDAVYMPFGKITS